MASCAKESLLPFQLQPRAVTHFMQSCASFPWQGLSRRGVPSVDLVFPTWSPENRCFIHFSLLPPITQQPVRLGQLRTHFLGGVESHRLHTRFTAQRLAYGSSTFKKWDGCPGLYLVPPSTCPPHQAFPAPTLLGHPHPGDDRAPQFS